MGFFFYGQVSHRELRGLTRPCPTLRSSDRLRAGLQGMEMLEGLVDVDGRPLQVDVEHSSGYRVLDNAARRYVLQHWTFRPAMRDGRPVQAVGLVPIAYSLD